MTRRITVLVGTDHHDFSRVVRWADAWQEEHPADEVLVQHGFSPAPSSARGVELVPPTELVDLLTGADVVVTHGGPGTIMSARHAGHRPLAVPRDPSFGEHVDGHQMRFVTWAAANGLCTETVSVEELSEVVAGLGPSGTRSETTTAATAAVESRRLEEVLSASRRRRDPSPTAVRVLYSPSALALPATASSVPVGNLATLWLGGTDVECSCGLGLRDCTFWKDVVERSSGGWDSAGLDRARSLHLAARSHRARAARRHPGAALRRTFVELGVAYRGVVAAVLEVAGAETVVDHGGPLSDVLLLSHCREIDLRVVGPARGDALTWAALRYRNVPTVPAPLSRTGAPSEPAEAMGHRLARPSTLQESIRR